MIKINLANTLLSKGDDSKSLSSLSTRETAIKIFLILIPVIGIYVFERMDLTAKNEKLASLQASLDEVTAKVAQSGSVSDIVAQKKELERESEEKKNVMRKIFGFRSQKILALTLLQDNIPPTCWFRKISINEKTVSVFGSSSDIQDAQTYIGVLSKQTNVFGNISGQDISEDKSTVAGRTAQYKFEFVLELKE
jgi:Tfp pilus assembly protein PilN